MSWFKAVKNYIDTKKQPDASASVQTYSKYNVRANSLVTIDETPFILHDEYTIMENPGSSHQVTDVGYLKVIGIDIYRFYMDSLDNKGESFIQVDENTSEIILFRTIDELYPQTVQEWSEWNGQQGLIVQDVFIVNGDVEYEKVWNSPVSTKEKIIPSSGSDYTYSVDMQLFKRSVVTEHDTFTEYLIVAIEEQERINIYVGLNVNSAGVVFS